MALKAEENKKQKYRGERYKNFSEEEKEEKHQ